MEGPFEKGRKCTKQAEHKQIFFFPSYGRTPVENSTMMRRMMTMRMIQLYFVFEEWRKRNNAYELGLDNESRKSCRHNN